ncbi:MAG: putative outer membrane repeat protein [Crocinitomicaceae bacterium]|jgi:predicted outer membrane repeat protein
MKNCIAFLSCFFVFVSFGSTVVVTNTNDNGVGSLREAVVTTFEGDTIRFDPALIAAGTDTIKLNSKIEFFHPLVFKGLYNSTDTLFISGRNLNGILDANMGVSTSMTLVLDSMFLIEGYSSANGGALEFQGEILQIFNSYICDNRALFSGGGVFCNAYNVIGITTNEVLIVNSKINNNICNNGSGGGVRTYATEDVILTIINCEVNGNVTQSGAGGGVIAFSASTFCKVNISDSEINNNTANDEGGGVYVKSVSGSALPAIIDSMQVTVSNSTIDNNSAEGEGGGIYSELDSENDYSTYEFTIVNSIISNNSSLDNGGGIYSYSNNELINLMSSELSLIDSDVTGNTASLSGGGVYSDSPYSVSSAHSFNIDNSNIGQNSATNFGGGVYARGYYAQMDVSNSTIYENSASNGGGVCFLTRFRSLIYNKALSIDKSTISTNMATTGGGIYMDFFNEEYESIITSNSTFYNNSATTGGAISATSSSSPTTYSLKFNSSIIVHNGASAISAINLQSQGYNVFSDAPVSGSVISDQLGVDSLTLNLGPLQNNGGTTLTHMPILPSPSIDMGDPTNLSSAQNWAIEGVRESGAAEVSSIIYDSLTVIVCDSLISPSGSQTWYTSGVFTDTIFGSPNDSLITVFLTIQVTYVTIIENNCTGVYNAPNGTVITVDGIYYDTVPNTNGCDSITTMIVSFYTPTFSSFNVNACSSYSSPSGNIWTSTGTYQDTIPNANGCDSVMTINLTIDQSYNSFSVVTCDSPYTAPSGNTFSSSGIYSDTISNYLGCDSILTINLTLNSATFSSINEIACNAYTSPSGVIYTSSGIYSDTIPNAASCDSIITINLVLNESFSAINESICVPNYTAPSGQIYSSSGTYSDTITNTLGCDSIISIDLTINIPSSSVLNISECVSYMSPSGILYSTSGTYQDTIQNSVGCDSVITINLQINESISSIIVETCDSVYTSPSGSFISNSGIFNDTILNAFGCDSIITIDLQINSLNATISQVDGITLQSDNIGLSYQWIDCGNGNQVLNGDTNQVFMATVNGDYAVIISYANCSDTSECFTIDQVGLLDLEFNDIRIYPVPVNTLLTVSLYGLNEPVHFEVVNTLGQVVNSGVLLGSETILDVSNIPSGTYFIKFPNSDINVQRFVKN